MPKQGVASSFKTGVGYGIIIGVLAALHIPTFFLSPVSGRRRCTSPSTRSCPGSEALERWPERR